MQISPTYWTVNVRYSLPHRERKAALTKLREAGLYKPTQARNSKAEAERIAADLIARGFDVEVNESADLYL